LAKTFELIKKDPLNDAKKYFNEAIRTSRQAMVLKDTSFENYLTCLQINVMSQLYTENHDGAIVIIRNKLKEFIKRPEIKILYHYLYFAGSDWKSQEMKIAYLIYNFINKLKMIKVVDDEFVNNVLTVRINRSLFHPSGKSGTWIDISNPMIKFRTLEEKVIQTLGGVANIIIFPTLVVPSLTVMIAISIASEPFKMSISALNNNVDDQKTTFMDRMKIVVKETRNEYSTDFKNIAHNSLESMFDLEVGSENFFEKYTNEQIIENMYKS